MIEEVMKAVKRNNKRRSVNITIGAVVGFLLSCTAIMGAAVEIKPDIAGENFVPSPPMIENIFDEANKVYTNNVTLSTAEIGIEVTGAPTDINLDIVNNGTIDSAKNGIKISTAIEGNIINNGIIKSKGNSTSSILLTGNMTGNIINSGEMSSEYLVIDVQFGGTLTGNIKNDGIIEAAGVRDTLGIIIGSNMTGNIENKGIVGGIGVATFALGGSLTTGDIKNDGIINNKTNTISITAMKGDVENNGVINIENMTGDMAGNHGIHVLPNFGALTGNIKNNGFIEDETIGTGTDITTGIHIENTHTGKGENDGRIVLTFPTSYGMKTETSVGTESIVNQGYLDITAATGAGIQVKNVTSKVRNNGNIRVTGTTESIGIKVNKTSELSNYGIVNAVKGNTGVGIEVIEKIDSFYNLGVIYGNKNAVKGHSTALNSNPMINYGLMIIEGNDKSNILSGTSFNLVPKPTSGMANYGMAFSVGTGDKAGKYFLEGNVTHTFSGSLVITAKPIETIDLAVGGEITGTESVLSSTLTPNPHAGFTDSYIINGINDTLTIDKDDENRILSKSSINAYGRAMVMEDGVSLAASNGTIFNGGVDGVSETVYLAGNNTLSLSNMSIINGNTKIHGNKNNFSMDASIQNGDMTAEGNNNNLNFKNGSIMNGEAVIKGAGNTLEIADGSIVNGDTSIEGNNNKLNISESIQNGNIATTGTGNNLSIDESILNGNIAIDGAGNTLNISGENTYINGDMTAVNGKNTLNLDGKSTDGKSLNIFHNVSGFNEINITDGNVTFFENSKVSGVDKVTVAEDGILNLRVKKSGEQTPDNLDKAAHAFISNEGMVLEGINDGGTLRFIANGIGEGVWVDTNGMDIRNMYIETNSVLDGYKFDEDDNIILKAYDDLDGMNHSGDKTTSNLLKEDIFDKENFDSINDIYKGIRSSTNKDDNLDALRDIVLFDRNSEIYDDMISKEEQLKNLQAYLNEVYTQSPYTLSSELSRKSAGMFREIVVENMFKPNLNQWMIMGGLTHVDGGTKDTYYGEVYEMDGKNSLGTKVDTKLTGAYALGKYGYSENVTLGVTVGGNRSEAELSRSKVKGNSGYIGAFAENYRGNLTLKAGAGVQYSEYDADRSTIGGYSYSDKYSDMAYDIYLNGRYSNPVGDNLFLEPYATFSYTYVDQEGTDEGNKALAIKTDSKSFDYTAAKVGVDLKKVIPHENGKSTLSAGISYTKLLSGADSDNLTGRFKGGSDFDIMVASKNEHSLGLNAKYALELESGILFDVKGSYSFERDSHRNNAKNRNKGEWIVGAGLGYKF